MKHKSCLKIIIKIKNIYHKKNYQKQNQKKKKEKFKLVFKKKEN